MITGKNLIGYKLSGEGLDTFKSYNPHLEKENPTVFFDASLSEIEEAVLLASKAFQQYQFFTAEQKLKFFQALENEMLEAKKSILTCYQLESGLPLSRSESEFSRTIAQIQQYSKLFDSNQLILPSIDTAIYDTHQPKSDIRKIKVGLGPVVVFGASNFPLAYSTLGGDTVAALAAGCSVIVKSHPMHAGTGELVGNAIIKALKYAEMPEGVFSNLNGFSNNVGACLVNHPMIKAVAFTGSIKGGRALFDLAARRKEPIPVFAEMGSLNPVVIDNLSLLKNMNKWTDDLADSVTNDAGQFCTKPGLIFIKSGQNVDEFVQMLISKVKEKGFKMMVHPRLKGNFENQLDDLSKILNIERHKLHSSSVVMPIAINISGSLFLTHRIFQEEVFGPFCFVIICKDDAELIQCIESLDGQLTASIFVEDEFQNESIVKQWISIFYNKSGRINFNNVPTGVRVCGSMHHGGPYPASSDSRFGAVGVDSIERFLRPLCFQNFPDALLPDLLKDKNPLNVLRRVNGELSFAEIIR